LRADSVFITFVGTGVFEPFQKNPLFYKNLVTGKLKVTNSLINQNI